LSPEPGDPRSLAAEVVDWALASRKPVDRFLQRVERDLEPRDRALLHELALGTLRWLRRLDSVIEDASSRQLLAIDASLRSPLRIAVYQLLFLDRVPAHAAVHEAVNEARRRTHRGGVGFVNAVLRRVAGSPRLEDWPLETADPIERLAVESSHPEFLVRRWIDSFGMERAERLLAANNHRRRLHLLALPKGGGREAVAAKLAEEGVEVRSLALADQGLEVVRGDVFSTTVFRTSGSVQPSEGGQTHELLITCGARLGYGSEPSTRVGAMKN